ncbi:MAG: carbon-nitrogen hydrolase family protein [Pseudomonadota bacterium]
MRIALLQMTSGIDPLENADTLCKAVSGAAEQGAAMLFAPEMSGLIDRDRARAAMHIHTEQQSPFLHAAARAAHENSLWVHLGSLPMRGDDADGKWRNRSLVIDDTGEIRARYDKIHLFDVDLPSGESWRESSAYAPGENAVTLETPLGTMGLTICYDLRFSALFDALTSAGASVIVVPSAFTVPTGEAHWHVLLRARAIDHGCFIIAAAQCGTHSDGRQTYGHSLVVDPWGTIVFDSGMVAGLSVIDIDLTRVSEVRARLPITRHKRPFKVPEPA